MSMCAYRYDQTSARVKGLENQAIRLSGEARDESKMSEGMLKNIATMERNLPTSLKVRAAVRRQNLFQKTVPRKLPK